MQEKIQAIVLKILRDFGEEFEIEDLKNPSLDSKIYGTGGGGFRFSWFG